MRLIHYILVPAVILFFGSRLSLLDATSQDWAGGTYESGYGTYYKMTFKARGGSEKLAVHDLWIGDHYFQVEAVSDPVRRKEKNFHRGDTVYVFSTLTYKPDAQGQYTRQPTENKACPREFTGAALLGYTWKGKQKYLEIKAFRELEKLIYP